MVALLQIFFEFLLLLLLVHNPFQVTSAKYNIFSFPTFIWWDNVVKICCSSPLIFPGWNQFFSINETSLTKLLHNIHQDLTIAIHDLWFFYKLFYVYDGSQSTKSDSDNNNNPPHCRICRMEFDDMTKMQRHNDRTMDKGDIPED